MSKIRRRDIAHENTDALISDMEKRVHSVYQSAYLSAEERLNKYLKSFEKNDKKWRERVTNGDVTKEQYQEWLKRRVFDQKRFEIVKDTILEDYTNADRITHSIVSGYLAEVYADNYNYATYTIELDSLVDTSFTLYNREAVEGLIEEEPDLLPWDEESETARLIREGKLEKWNEKAISREITVGIVAGEPLMKIAERLQHVTDMDEVSARRNARTAMTGAQNAGRVRAFERAEKMGIELKQMWVATLDGRTRHQHRLLDGQVRKVGEPFEVDGKKIRYPADPQAEPYLVYNCRCAVIAKTKRMDTTITNRNTSKMGGMSYEEWKSSKPKYTRKKKGDKRGNKK